MARKTGSHAEITGPAVRAAALRLFARSGYAAVSMREIAKEVGVHAGALYLYTPDKQTLLYDLMREHLEELLLAWREKPKLANPVAQLEAFIRFHVGFHIDLRDAVFLAYMELRNLSPENYTKIQSLRREYEGELEAILDEGASNGAFEVDDIRLAAMAILAMLTGVNTWYRQGGRLERDRIEEIYWTMTRRMVTQ